MSARIFRLLMLAGVLLAACQPAAATPIPTQAVIELQLTPALGWLGAPLNACAAELNVAVITDEKPAPALDLTGGVALRWGAPQPLNSYAAELGADELVVIVNPANRLSGITRKDLRSLVQGRTAAWRELFKDDTLPAETVQVWVYPAGEDTAAVVERLLGQAVSNRAAWLAPDPAAARQAVAADPGAIGFLPRRWLDSSVRAVPLTDVPADLQRAPILALSPAEPTGLTRDVLVCVQRKIES